MCWSHAVRVAAGSTWSVCGRNSRRTRRSLLWLWPATSRTPAPLPLVPSPSPSPRYDFNMSDFDVSELCLRLYLDDYDETPWEALKYLISEINYGGRDRRLGPRLMNVYMASFFNEDAHRPGYRSPRSQLRCAGGRPAEPVPRGVRALPRSTGVRLRSTRTRTSPRKSDGQRDARGSSRCSRVDRLVGRHSRGYGVRLAGTCSDDPRAGEHREGRRGRRLGAAHRARPGAPAYNSCSAIRRARGRPKGIKGLVVMTKDLDAVFEKLLSARAPEWHGVPRSSRSPRGRAISRCAGRADGVVREGAAKVFWLAGFTYPMGFLTALMQTSARTTTCRSTR